MATMRGSWVYATLNGALATLTKTFVMYVMSITSPDTFSSAEMKTRVDDAASPKKVELSENDPSSPLSLATHGGAVQAFSSLLANVMTNSPCSDAPGTVMLPEPHEPSHSLT